MKIASKERVHDAITAFLEPLARVLIQHDIGATEVIELLKVAYVSVASETFGRRGRPTNMSRTAMLTGLSRRSVRLIRKSLDEHTVDIPPSFATTVLAHWLSSPAFVDADGEPRALPYKGQTGSIVALVNEIGTKIPPGAVKAELLRMEAIRETTHDVYEVNKSVVQDNYGTVVAMELLSRAIRNAIENIPSRLAIDMSHTLWPPVSTESAIVNEDDLPKIRSLSQKYAAKLHSEVQVLFATYEELRPAKEKNQVTYDVTIQTTYSEKQHRL